MAERRLDFYVFDRIPGVGLYGEPRLHLVARLAVAPCEIRNEFKLDRVHGRLAARQIGKDFARIYRHRRIFMAENLALRHGEFRIGRNNLVQDIPVIVKAFGTVKNRTLLHGKTPTIGFDAIVGLDTFDGHVHANRNLVSRLPFTRNDLVSSLVCEVHGFAVDRNGKIVIGSGNSLAVERARHRFSDAPSGDTDEKLEIGNGGIKSKLDITVPRICRFLRKLDLAALEFKLHVAFDKEVYIDFVVSRCKRHARNLRNETDDVYRTA